MAIDSSVIGIIICLVFMNLCLITQCYPEDQRITSLPGQPSVSFQQYSGHITLDEATQRKIFYYLAEAETDSRSKPLVLWLAGGPGCPGSPAAFDTNGPYRVKFNGTGLLRNDFSYNREANMLYLDSPAPTGFSVIANDSLKFALSDEVIVQDNLLFMRLWLEKFPEYADRDLYIGGHSYAGHYIADLAKFIIQQKNLKLNVKGVMGIGASLDLKHDVRTYPEFLWSHGLISDSAYELLKKSTCDYVHYLKEFDVEIIYGSSNTTKSPECSAIHKVLQEQFQADGFVPLYYLIGGRCELPPGLTIEQASHLDQATLTDCMGSFSNRYLSRQKVLDALHVPADELSGCIRDMYVTYSPESFWKSMIPTYKLLLHSGIRVLLANGDQDGRIPLISTRTQVDKMAKDLGLATNISYSPWYFREQLGGWRQAYGGNKLAFATVKGGGHMFEKQRPEPAFVLFQGFLRGDYTLPKASNSKP